MITPEYAQTMAAYNQWQNHSLYDAAAGLSDEGRRADRGAFFGSIHRTLNHILWADMAWLHRFTGAHAPPVSSLAGSVEMIEDWAVLRKERERFDDVIVQWAAQLREEDMAGDLTWFSGAMNKEFTQPRRRLIVHMFNHQTHHRGQVHAMLTAAGARPGVTDLPFLSED